MNMKTAGLLPGLALLLAGAAQAGAPVSEVTTFTKDAVFTGTGGVTVSFTANSDLKAGKPASRYIGHLTVTPASQSDQVAWRWTPGVGGVPTDKGYMYAWPGKNDPTHTVVLYVYNSGTATGDAGWYKAEEKGTLDTSIMTNPDFVAPDTYTASVDAAVWMD